LSPSAICFFWSPSLLSFLITKANKTTVEKDITEILKSIQSDVMRSGNHLRLVHRASIMAMVKPDAFKRLVVNLVNNAVRFGDMVELDAEIRDKILYVMWTITDQA